MDDHRLTFRGIAIVYDHERCPCGRLAEIEQRFWLEDLNGSVPTRDPERVAAALKLADEIGLCDVCKAALEERGRSRIVA